MQSHDDWAHHIHARLAGELFLGRGAHTRRLYHLGPGKCLSTHVYILGSPGFGKSYYMEHLLREHLKHRRPASIIDPHGDQAAAFFEFARRIPRLTREKRLVRFQPGASTNITGFNPFDCGVSDPATVASLVLEAFMKVWGERSFNETPRLERILRSMFYLFAANDLPLTRSYQFLRADNRPFRQKLLTAVPDEQVRESWSEIEALPKSEKLDRFESSWNRLQRFLALPAVSALFGPSPNALQFRRMFDRGEVLVADLSRLGSTEAESLVGTMMVNALYHAAKNRPKARRAPWVLAIDEFPQFVTTDLARSLDQSRKFGVHLVLAHQRLAQLSEDLLSAVMGCAGVKAVLGGLSRPDAEILARALFTGEVDGKRVKHITYQTKFRPTLVERQVDSFSEISGEGDTDSDAWSSGGSSMTGDGHVDSWSMLSRAGSPDVNDHTISHALSSSSSWTSNFGRSGGRNRSRSKMDGHSWSTALVTEHEEFREETGREFWPLDEQWEILTARIMELAKREALVKVFSDPVLDIMTPDVRHLVPRPRPQLVRRKAKPMTGKVIPPKPGAEPPPDALPEDFRE